MLNKLTIYLTTVLLLSGQTFNIFSNQDINIEHLSKKQDLYKNILKNRRNAEANFVYQENPDEIEGHSWPSNSDKGKFRKKTRSPLSIGLNFTGMTSNNSRIVGFSPPDTMGVVGPSQFIVATNEGIRSFDKATGQADGVLNVSLDSFFNSSGNSINPIIIFDPRIRYDKHSTRWFIIAENKSQPNTIYIAVSSDSIITKYTTWDIFPFVQDQVNPAGDFGDFSDYPTLGIDKDALYIGVNNFDVNGFYQNSTGFVIQKSSLLNGGPMVINAFRGLNSLSGGIFTPQGVDNFDTNSTYGYFIGASTTTNSTLVIFRISNPGSTNPTISSPITLTTLATRTPALSVPHKGNLFTAPTGNLDASSTRLFMAHIRNDHLFTTHHIPVNQSGNGGATVRDRDAARWYEIDVSTPVPTIVESGTLWDSISVTNPRFYFYPSIMTNANGDLTVSCSTAGSTHFIDAVTCQRTAPNTLGPVTFITNTSYTYNFPFSGTTRRWGDYSYTSVDPVDDTTMWTIQEFCFITNTFGCQVAQLLM